MQNTKKRAAAIDFVSIWRIQCETNDRFVHLRFFQICERWGRRNIFLSFLHHFFDDLWRNYLLSYTVATDSLTIATVHGSTIWTDVFIKKLKTKWAQALPQEWYPLRSLNLGGRNYLKSKSKQGRKPFLRSENNIMAVWVAAFGKVPHPKTTTIWRNL